MASGPPHDALTRALDVLGRFLDQDLESFDRTLALNDASVPDEIVLGFLRVLDPPDRWAALARCWRPKVLAGWADVADRADLAIIARNCWTPSSTFRVLLKDGDEEMRFNIAHGCVEDTEIAAWLLADGSPRVRAAMRETLAHYRVADEQVREQFRADAPLEWLHEAVPAAENEDLLEAYAADEMKRHYGQWYDDPPATCDPDPELVTEKPDPELEAAVAVLKGVFGAHRVLGDG